MCKNWSFLCSSTVEISNPNPPGIQWRSQEWFDGCLTIVGWVAVLLGIFSIIPFVVMGLVAIPKVKPSRWLVVNLRNVDWNLYLNTLLESQLLGLDKYTCWRGRKPKENSPKGSVLCFDISCSWIFLPALNGYWGCSTRPWVVDRWIFLRYR